MIKLNTSYVLSRANISRMESRHHSWGYSQKKGMTQMYELKTMGLIFHRFESCSDFESDSVLYCDEEPVRRSRHRTGRDLPEEGSLAPDLFLGHVRRQKSSLNTSAAAAPSSAVFPAAHLDSRLVALGEAGVRTVLRGFFSRSAFGCHVED